jgi:plasmid rolling circle replication initiator protein Rep
VIKLKLTKLTKYHGGIFFMLSVIKIQENEKKVKKNFKYHLKNDGKVKQNITSIAKISFYKRHYNQVLSDKCLSVAKEYDDYLYQQLAFRALHCGDTVDYMQFSNGKQKIINIFTCQLRLCMVCNYRRSQRTFAKLIRVIKHPDFTDKKYKLIFLTLTLKNINPDELKQGINHIFYSFDKFLKNKKIKRMNKGFFRALEITFNEKDRTFHHHMHIVFVVNNSYFKHPDLYLKQADFTNIWQSSAGLDYTPVCFVEKVKDNKGLAEVAKYAVKADEKFIKKLTNLEFMTLFAELRNRRLVSMGGVIRDIARKLKLNLDDNDITSDDIDDDDIKDEVLQAIIGLHWSVGFGKYRLVKKENPNF